MRLLATFLAAVIITAAPAAAQEKPTPEEIREAKIYDTFAEMIIRRDDLCQRFAVVLYGEVVYSDDSTVRMTPTVSARAVCRDRKFDLRTRYHPGDWHSGQVQVQLGDELFRGKPFGEISDEPPARYSGWVQGFSGGHNPFDDYLIWTLAMSKDGDYGEIERTVLGKYELQSSEQSIGGRIVANFTCRRKISSAEIEIEFSEAHDMMPVRYVERTTFTDKRMFPKGAPKMPPTEMRIDWRKHNGQFLPWRIRYLTLGFSGPDAKEVIREEYALRCFWLVGDELTDKLLDAMIDGKHDDGLNPDVRVLLGGTGNAVTDHLSPLLAHFDIPHPTLIAKTGESGNILNIPPFEYTPPEGLYE